MIASRRTSKFTKARHVLCGAYLLRELNGLKKEGSRWAVAMHQFLLDLCQQPRPVAVVEAVPKPYQTILAQADREENPLSSPARAGDPSNPPAQPPGPLANTPKRGSRLCLGGRGPVHE